MLLHPFTLSVLMVQSLTAFRRGEGPTNTHHHSPPVHGQLPLGMAKLIHRKTVTAQLTTQYRGVLPHRHLLTHHFLQHNPQKFSPQIQNLLKYLRMHIKTLFPMENQNSKFLFIFLYAKKHRWKTTQKILNKIQFAHFFQKLSPDFSKQLEQHKTILICSMRTTIHIF